MSGDFNFDPRTAVSRAFIVLQNAWRVIIGNSTSDPVNVQIVAPKTPTTVALTSPATPLNEFNFDFPVGVKKFAIVCRKNVQLEHKWDAGESFFLDNGSFIFRDNIYLETGKKQITMRVDKASVPVNIEYWI